MLVCEQVDIVFWKGILMKELEPVDYFFYGSVLIAIVFLGGRLVVSEIEHKKSRNNFTFYFDISYPYTQTEKKQVAPTILNRLNEVRKNLEERKERGGDDQLQVTFNDLCELAKDHGFSDEAVLARCPP